jgi:tetratricopeptide (TPR) repeat protein
MEERESKGERYFQRGLESFKKARFKKAKHFFQVASSFNYSPSLCFIHIGIIQLVEMEISESFQTFQTVLATGENTGEVYFYMGKVFQAFDKKAIFFSKDEISRLLAYEEIQHSVSGEEKERLYQAATNSYLIRHNIAQDEEILRKGILARIRGSYEEAVEVFQEMVSFYPDYFQGYLELARTYIGTLQYHRAYDILKKVKITFKKERLVLKEIARMTFLLRRFKECIYYTRKLLELNPKKPRLFFNLATILALTGRDNEAIKYFKKAVELNQYFFEAHYNIGYTYQKNGFLEESLDAYQKALAQRPDHAELNYNLGLIYFEIQDYFQALFYFMKSYQLDKDLKEGISNFEVIRNLKTIENNVIKPLELSLPSKISLAFSVVVLVMTFFYLIRWI